VKSFGERFYSDHGVDWRNVNCKSINERMPIEAFPLLWQDGIDKMSPLFFRAVRYRECAVRHSS
jgi:hypothetical protein